MKKVTSHVACMSMLLFATTAAFAAPPAGTIAIDVPPAAHVAISIPYAEATLHAEAESGLPLVLRKWDAVGQVYEEAWLAGDALFADAALTVPSPMQLLAGDGIFLSHATAVTQRLYVAGSLLLDDTAAIELLPGLNLLGNAYATITPTNALPHPVTVAWPFEPQGDSLPLAAAFWKQNATGGDANWTVDRPYENAFSVAGLLPIASVYSGESGFEIVVSADGSISLLTKDLTPDTAFTAKTGWQILAGGLSPTDGSVLYVDNRALEPAAFPAFPARYYLAVDDTLDTDGDGLADALEIFVYGTSPNKADSDGDGISDGDEIANGTDPLKAGEPIVLAESTTYYVNAATGDDGDDGLTEDTAKATITAAIAVAGTGDQIYVNAGTYPEGRVTLPAGVRMVAVGRVVLQ